MKNSLSFLLNSAEYFLIIAVFIYWYYSSLLNPIAIGLFLILVFQIIFRNKIIGIFIPIVLILLSIYMLLALNSEVSEFKTFNNDAGNLLIFGLTLFLGTIIISFLMIFNYIFRMLHKNEKFA